jgi:hypothetical protein
MPSPYPCHFCGEVVTEDAMPDHIRRRHPEVVRQLCDWEARH